MEEIFAYAFQGDAPENDLEAKCRQFAEIVRGHAIKHDFAQKMLPDRFHVKTLEFEGCSRNCIVVPFMRENIRELGALNYYAKTCGETLGLHLVALILPGELIVPL